ncbi:MAG: hypothetical protein AAF480_14405 [Actinomycetota bacterium]
MTTLTPNPIADASVVEPSGSRPPRWLVGGTVAYLLAPLMIFLATWVRWEVGLAAAALLSLAARDLLRDVADGPGLGAPAVAGVGVFAVVLTWLSGAGDIGYQAGDWWKHNAVFTDLVVEPWPVVYDIGGTVGLDYYLAHYLPAAAVGKLGGFWLGNAAMVAWTAAGIVMVGAWMVVLVRRAWVPALATFVALSGLDVVGWLLFEPLTGAPAEAGVGFEGAEFWNGNFAYLSQLTNVADAPHQSMGIWLLTSLLLWAVLERRDLRWLPIVMVVSPFWSAFATIGLIPFAALAIWRERSSWRALVGARQWLLAPVALVVLAYFAARRAAVPAVIEGGVDVSVIFADPRYDIGLTRLLVALGLFLVLELVLPAVVVRRHHRFDGLERHLALVSLAVLVAVLPIRVSGNHDLMLRGTGPAILVLTVLVARLVAGSAAGTVARRSLVALLAVGSLTGGVVIARALTAEQRPVYDRADAEVGPGLVEFYSEDPATARYLSQYVSGTDSFFWRTLAAPD